MKKVFTLCVLHKDPYVLLGLKKRGFGVGKWNGFGGKVHGDEKIEDAAVREMKEECGIVIHGLEKCGIIQFQFVGGEDIMEVHYFRILEHSGEVQESEEMRPQWFHKDNIPLEAMWAEAKDWFGIFLDEKKFEGKVLYSKEGDKIVESTLRETNDFSIA